MAGTLSAHTAGGGQDAGDEASYYVTGTGTSNDGKRVRGRATIGAGGTPVDFSSLGLARGSKAVTTPTIGNTATVLLAANAARKAAIIVNPKTATQTLYIGVSGVTTSAYALALDPGGTYIDNDSNDAWYGIMASGSQAVNVTEIS